MSTGKRFGERLLAFATLGVLSALSTPVVGACPHPVGWKPSIEELRRQQAAYLAAGDDILISPPSACNADLRNADLRDLNLSDADFDNADLSGANLTGAHLGGSFRGANLSAAKAKDTVLIASDLSHANLGGTDFENAYLVQPRLTGARLTNTNLANARLENPDLTDATYDPRGAPPASIMRQTGLETVTFRDATGVSQLRQLARQSGQRDIERAATFAIERDHTKRLRGENLSDWLGYRPYPPMIEGLFRRIAFEWTTGYGLYPGRALRVILLFMALLAPLYALVIWRGRPFAEKGAIYRVLPGDRIEVHDDIASTGFPAEVQRLSAAPGQALAWGCYFSLLSAFNIGFRDLNVGNWIYRAQSSKFQLEPLGWVRTVSGLQSLLSLYLLAMWLLTYFGRPFE